MPTIPITPTITAAPMDPERLRNAFTDFAGVVDGDIRRHLLGHVLWLEQSMEMLTNLLRSKAGVSTAAPSDAQTAQAQDQTAQEVCA